MLIKACPFCGKTSAINLEKSTLTGSFHFIFEVEKGGCGATAGFCEGSIEAEQMWNHRKIGDAQKILFEQLNHQQKLIMKRQEKLAMCMYEIGTQNLEPEKMSPQLKEAMSFIRSLLPDSKG